MLSNKKSMKFLTLFLALTLSLPITTQAFAWCCPPRPRVIVRCCPPPPPRCYYYHGYYGNSPAACGVAGFATGVVVGTVVATSRPCPEPRRTVTVTETVTLPLIFHKF